MKSSIAVLIAFLVGTSVFNHVNAQELLFEAPGGRAAAATPEHYEDGVDPEVKTRLAKTIGTAEELSPDWVAAHHVPAMCKVANKYGVAITLRETGSLSVKRITQGYPTKGHDILDKSLKPAAFLKFAVNDIENVSDSVAIVTKGILASARAAYSKDKSVGAGETLIFPESWGDLSKLRGPQLMQKINNLNLDGAVGWWVATGEYSKLPIGVYTVSSACPWSNGKAVEGGCKLTFAEYAELIAKQQAPEDLYTGDYDLHDLIAVGSVEHRIAGGYRLPSGLDVAAAKDLFHNDPLLVGDKPPKPHDDYGNYGLRGNCDGLVPELQVSCAINQETRAADKRKGIEYLTRETSHHNVIRHGPQATYFEFALLAHEPLIKALVKFDDRVAAIEPLDVGKDSENCRYYVLNRDGKSSQEIVDFYTLIARGAKDSGQHGQYFGPQVLAAKSAKYKQLLSDMATPFKAAAIESKVQHLKELQEHLTTSDEAAYACHEILLTAEQLVELKAGKDFSPDSRDVYQAACTVQTVRDQCKMSFECT
jgi:hypothetical protein